jgi:hypothetical protein
VTFLPEASETLVVAHDWSIVLQRLNEVTSQQPRQSARGVHILAGWVKDDKFQLIIRQRRPNSFMPVVEGRIDPTQTGCLVFLRYRLMPFTRLYLILWTIIALISGILLAVYYYNLLLAAAAIIIISVIHLVAWANFRIHQRPLRDIIFNVLA